MLSIIANLAVIRKTGIRRVRDGLHWFQMNDGPTIGKFYSISREIGWWLTMKRYGCVIRVKEEKLQEYKDLHAAVWPDVLAVFPNHLKHVPGFAEAFQR